MLQHQKPEQTPANEAGSNDGLAWGHRDNFLFEAREHTIQMTPTEYGHSACKQMRKGENKSWYSVRESERRLLGRDLVFSCEETIKIKTEKSEKDVLDDVENALQRIGNVSLTGLGHFSISTGEYADAFTDVTIEGNIRSHGEGYTLTLAARIQPTLLDWVFGICFFPLGFALFFVPVTKKTNIASKFESVAMELR